MTVAGEQIRWDEVKRELGNDGRWKATGRRHGGLLLCHLILAIEKNGFIMSKKGAKSPW